MRIVIEISKLKNMSLLAMSEVQGVGSGILEVNETTVLFSGLAEKKDGNQRGVAVALRGNLRNGITQTRKKAIFSIMFLSATNIDPKYVTQKSLEKQFIYQTII